MTDLWEQLQGRRQPTSTVRLPREPGPYAAAEDAWEEAARALQAAHAGGQPPAEIAALQAAVDAAAEVLAEQPMLEFTVTAIPATDWEDLVAAHPPTAEQAKKGWVWNVSTFRPAVLSIALEPTLSEHQWHAVAESGQVGLGEIDTLFGEVVKLSNRSPRVAVGKG
ncbi:hypothetical protein [Pseudonocardia sp.]|uniref:hypothetical protein n=1 Tax=Pseudonocardia sp. TaxID=60912 RepID=UPI003D10EFF4